MAKPDLDNDNEDAVEARVDRAREARKSASANDIAPAKVEDTEGVTVDLDDEPDDEPAAPQGPSRREKRANRFREAQDRAEAAERRAEEVARELQELRARQAQPQYQPQQPQHQPSGDEDADKLYEERVKLSESWAAIRDKATPEVAKQFTERARKLEWDYYQAMQKRNAPPQEDPQVTHLKLSNYDVLAHPQARAYAQSEILRAQANNEPASIAVYQRAFEAARKHFRLGNYANSAPSSASQRSRYEGAPRGGGSSGKDSSSSQVRLSKEDVRMANAAYAHIKDEKQRLRMYAQKKAQREKRSA